MRYMCVCVDYGYYVCVNIAGWIAVSKITYSLLGLCVTRVT